jgi:lysophospholipid acyltransferase (LPLAT)-like uncharacterized protein
MSEQKKTVFSEWKLNVIGLMGKLLIDLLFFTIKTDIIGYEKVRSMIDSRQVILSVWHSRLFAFSYMFKGLGGVAMVSESRDGEMAVQIVKRQGNSTVRGSSTRGGIHALKKMISILKKGGGPGIITPDGPQGPRFRVQPGVILLAKKTGFPIVPVTYSGDRIKIFHSWDRFILPYPFSTVQIIFGNPLEVPSDGKRPEEQEIMLRLQDEMQRITSQADHRFGHDIT